MVGVATGEYVGLVFQAPERPRMNYTITVSLEITAIRVLRLRIASTAALFCRSGAGRGRCESYQRPYASFLRPGHSCPAGNRPNPENRDKRRSVDQGPTPS